MSNNAWNSEYNSAKGAILAGNGTRPVVRTVGADGFVLTADSTQADGVNWLVGGGSGATDFLGNFGVNANPIAGLINIVGNMGVLTSTSGNTVEINSLLWTSQIIPYFPSPNTGTVSIATSGITLPVATEGQMIRVFAATAPTVITAQAGQTIQNGATISVLGGTATSTGNGDAIEFVMNAAGTSWLTLSRNGSWIVV